MPYDTTPPKRDPDDDLFEICPVARAFEIVGSKWRLTILRSLHLYGEQQFSTLQEITTADSATLSRVLEDLEEQDLINRRLEDRPIATYYSLTERGEALPTYSRNSKSGPSSGLLRRCPTSRFPSS